MRHRLTALALAPCLVIVGAACGRSEGNGAAKPAIAPSSTAASGARKDADFGTVRSVCTPGTPSGSPSTGVTPTAVRVATFSDRGFVGRPGLNQEFFDTADVFAAWCNDRGGINGRKIVVDKRDAELINVKPRMTESCIDDFALVGGGATFDQDGVETRLRCLLPDFAGFVVSAQARGADLVVQPLPNTLEHLQIGTLNYLASRFPAATKKVGVLTGDISTTKVVAAQNAEGATAIGWNIVYNDQYPAGGLADWTPYAQKLKDSGVKGLIWVGEPEGLALLLHAVKDIGYTLDFVRADANHYDQKLIDLGTDALAGNNVFIQSSFAPFEQAIVSNATGQFLQAFKDYAPNGKSRAYLGLQAWSAWLLFATAAKTCGNDLTRKCVLNAAQKVRTWTGGGLHATTDPGGGTSTGCNLVEVATPQGFKVAPGLHATDGIYNCSPKNIHTLTGDYGKGTTLADVGQSIDHLE